MTTKNEAVDGFFIAGLRVGTPEFETFREGTKKAGYEVVETVCRLHGTSVGFNVLLTEEDIDNIHEIHINTLKLRLK